MTIEHSTLVFGDYEITSDITRIDWKRVHEWLASSYWTPGISFERVKRAGENSALILSAYRNGEQAAYARVVSDKTRFAYLCDVYVLPEFRGQGLSKWLMECVLSHPDLQHLRRFMLATKDAHGLYARFGFKSTAAPERLMEIVNREVYKTPESV